MDQPLSLKQLVQIVPVEEKIKQQVFSEEDRLTADQKYRISKLCWALLSTIFEERMRQKSQAMLKEMAEEGKEYEQEDFRRLEDEVMADLLIKLDEVKSQKELSEIKSQLKASITEKQQKTQTTPTLQRQTQTIL
ncbi:unnamed protein product [marine sediment metagenome]|uniref:Uncharacterized protein n=1 Tax=marine sediment metagenome TaxID=412755 RepID=X0UKU0_9ZZZZ